MELSTKKHLYKLTINAKACGEVEIAAKCENKELIFYGKIVGNYDDITAFEPEKILNAMEALFDEKVKSIKEFIDFASNYETIRGALERGFKKWENESHPNN